MVRKKEIHTLNHADHMARLPCNHSCGKRAASITDTLSHRQSRSISRRAACGNHRHLRDSTCYASHGIDVERTLIVIVNTVKLGRPEQYLYKFRCV